LNIAYKLLFNAELINSTLSNRSVAMQPNKTKLALKIGAVVLGALCASGASAETFTATVNTVADVRIDRRAGTALDFGQSILVQSGGICTVQVGVTASTEAPGGLLMNYDRASPTAAGVNYGTLDGAGCLDGVTSQAGIWDAFGAAGAAVSILFTELPQEADFTFEPSGCYVFYGPGNDTDTDTCAALPINTATAAKFSLSDALESDAGTPGTNAGTPISGQFSFAVGGTITVGATDLDPATPYNVEFQVDVTY
jgi:hypothetical protein